MRYFWSILIFTLTGCSTLTEQSKVKDNIFKLTVIKYDNQNIRFEIKTDTLIKSQTVDLNDTKIDIYFCNKYLHIPYYMPTNGIYKDSIKDKECEWSKYPSHVKCYEYDNKGRVIEMQVSGSGTMGSHTYIYNENDKITSMTDNHLWKYKMDYNTLGNLITLVIDRGEYQKRLEFEYRK